MRVEELNVALPRLFVKVLALSAKKLDDGQRQQRDGASVDIDHVRIYKHLFARGKRFHI